MGLTGDKHPQWKGGMLIDSYGYAMIRMPEHPRAHQNHYVKEHIVIAERALGKPLPPNAVVHHFNEIKWDNAYGNLVICQDEAYHRLLHARQRALHACGNPNFRKCPYCKTWDNPNDMKSDKKRKGHQDTFYHLRCRTEYNKQWRHRRKEQELAGR
jgi:hypothetical protein